MSSPRFEVESSPQVLSVAFHGRLDSAGCAALNDALLAQSDQVEPGQHLRFDLAHSDFVASAFLRLCILAARRVGGARIELAHLTPLVREVFVMAGLDRHLRIDGVAAS